MKTYDVVLRDLQSNLCKPEGYSDFCYLELSTAYKMPLTLINEKIFNKIINEKLYLIPADTFIQQMVDYTNKNFVCENTNSNCLSVNNGVCYIKGAVVETYGLIVSCSEELIYDYRCKNVDVVNGMRIYVLMSLFKTLIEFRSQEFTHLWWHEKPIILEKIAAYNDCVVSALGRMRLAIQKQE